MNPDLLNAANGPGNSVSVPPAAKWKHRREEDGQLVESFRPLSNIRGEMRYYHSKMPTASMYRPDGMRLAFIDGFLETDIIASQQYIEEEIENGCMYVTVAAPDQVEYFKMRRDPRGTITAQVEQELRQRLEGEIREKLIAELSGDDSVKIAGVDNPTDRLAALKKKLGHEGETVVTSGNATVVMTGSTSGVTGQQLPHLKGIVSTDDLAGGQSGSTSGQTGVPSK